MSLKDFQKQMVALNPKEFNKIITEKYTKKPAQAKASKQKPPSPVVLGKRSRRPKKRLGEESSDEEVPPQQLKRSVGRPPLQTC